MTDSFYSNRSWCKKCLLSHQHTRFKARKKKAVELFGGCCGICGYNKNLAALDFHHIDPNTKESLWGRFSKRKWSSVLLELNKCVLLCKNCHMEHHFPEMSLDAINIEDATRILDKCKTLTVSGHCPICEADVFGTTFCSNACRGKMQQRVERPDKEILAQLISSMSWTALGKKYGVSDNAVRKWARAYGLL